MLQQEARWSSFENLIYSISGCSAVGSALGLGPRCRGFESLHSDHKKNNTVWYCSFYFCIEIILILQHFNQIKRPLGLGYEHDCRRWRMQGVFIGAAVKIVSDEQERLTILGTARGGVTEDVGGSNPFTPTKNKSKSSGFGLFFHKRDSNPRGSER